MASIRTTKSSPPTCPYCGQASRRVVGASVYPHRPDLRDNVLYQCAPCGAWVGCHPGTDQPLGRLANAELRRAKMAAHSAFDPIWMADVARGASRKTARGAAYFWFATALGMTREDCHIGMMDVATCQRVVAVCRARITQSEAA